MYQTLQIALKTHETKYSCVTSPSSLVLYGAPQINGELCTKMLSCALLSSCGMKFVSVSIQFKQFLKYICGFVTIWS